MINLIATNAVVSKRNFLGLFRDAAEAQACAQEAVAKAGNDDVLLWGELPVGNVMREAFMIGSLLPVRVLHARYSDFALIILDYGF